MASMKATSVPSLMVTADDEEHTAPHKALSDGGVVKGQRSKKLMRAKSAKQRARMGLLKKTNKIQGTSLPPPLPPFLLA